MAEIRSPEEIGLSERIARMERELKEFLESVTDEMYEEIKTTNAEARRKRMVLRDWIKRGNELLKTLGLGS